MKTISRMILAGAALAVAGCTNLPGGSLGETFSAESYLGMPIEGQGFNAALAREYQELAAYNANTSVNWIDTTAYIDKSQRAANGENVSTWDPAELGVGGEAAAMRGEVVSTVQANASARPQECAEAMALYDQWLESLYQAPALCPDPAEAEAAFEAALAACRGAAAPSDMTVYFGFDRSDLTAAADAVIRDIVAGLSGSPAISVVGHTDTVASVEYNQGLSERRAASVANRMVSLGVNPGQITTAGRSERVLAVPTADGVREPLNRRVEITVSE